jgi:alkanesulfonate monooxygenase SsuD/methylene tetrahydromethanopterin reductase-like flavin-dependent oxidoreductase (luciferase family)
MTGATRVEFGIYLPQVGFGPDELLTRARAAEACGFHSVWFFDHLYGPGQPDLPALEGWTLATWVLARTTSLRVGNLVLCNNFRHPALLGKMATTLDVVSDGRLELGLGSGSVEREHRQAGLPWGTTAERAERLAEALEILSSMFAGPRTSHAGRHYRIDDLPNVPGPVQRPRPPIHVGGIGPRRTMPLVARHADVWSIPTYGLGAWEASAQVLEEECERIGRDPASIRRSHEAVLVLAEDERGLVEARRQAERRYAGPGWGLDAGGYAGTPAQVIERIARAADRGITLFIFFTHDRAHPDTLELLAERVMPAFG